jgi:hypothetical protein
VVRVDAGGSPRLQLSLATPPAACILRSYILAVQPMTGIIFISYTKVDRKWAHWIGVVLRENEYQPKVHEWEVAAGQNIAQWMDESMEVADRLLGVFSSFLMTMPGLCTHAQSVRRHTGAIPMGARVFLSRSKFVR